MEKESLNNEIEKNIANIEVDLKELYNSITYKAMISLMNFGVLLIEENETVNSYVPFGGGWL